MTKAVCVFLASSFGKRLSYTYAAKQLAREIARRHYTLVYGGSKLGLMGILADTALENGATVIGVINESIYDAEAHPNLTELHVVKTLFERKKLMTSLSDGYISMPGGIGTFDEIFEILAANRAGLNKNTIGLLNVDGYFDKLLKLIDYSAQEDFLQKEFIDSIPVHHDVEILLDAVFCSEISSMSAEELQR